MGKLVGSVLILTGSMLFLYNWGDSVRRRQVRMREIIRMFRSWEYTLQTRRMRVTDFLEQFRFAGSTLKEVFEEVRGGLLTYEYPSGEIVWEQMVKKHKKTLGLSSDAYVILLQSAESFFGTNQREALQSIRQCILLMQRCMQQEQESYREKRKVYMPVGMLMGVMLVILLI